MNEQDVFSFSATCIKNYPGQSLLEVKHIYLSIIELMI